MTIIDKGSCGPIEKILSEPVPPNGTHIVKPADNEIFVDLDSVEAKQEFEHRMGLLHQLEEAEVTTKPSKRKDHFHVTIKLKRSLSPIERVALQAALGSDWRRELFACIKWKEIQDTHTCFFEKDCLTLPPESPIILSHGGNE